MAKTKKPQVTDDANDEVNDLLDGAQDTQNSGSEETQTPENQEEEARDIEWNGKMYTKSELEAELKNIQETAKKLKAAVKGEKAPATRTAKGVMVAFKNKAGETIIGPGVLYYVARANSKLHYKEASQVVLLPEGWKEGDPIPELPTKEVAAEAEAEAPVTE